MTRRVVRYDESQECVEAEVRPYELHLRFEPNGAASVTLLSRVADGDEWCRRHGMVEDRAGTTAVSVHCVAEILREVDTIFRLAKLQQPGES